MTDSLSADDFQAKVVDSDDVVLVDFWASWCGPCQLLLPTIEELASEVGKGASVYKVNVDEAPEIAQQYGVMSVPTLKLFKKGAVVDEIAGVQSKEDLLAMIDRHR